ELRRVALARLHGLDNSDAGAALLQGDRERRRDDRLADAGIGARDEKAPHEIASSRIDAIRSRSSTGVASGGISVITFPSGRVTRPRSRARRQAGAPGESSSMPTMKPHC